MKVRYDNKTGRLGKAYPETMQVPDPYIILTTDEIDNIVNQTDKLAFVVDGSVVLKDKAEIEAQEQKLKEAERIAMLHMTKLDFFNYVCKPYGITYAQLEEVIAGNDDLKANWNLCNHVYRGNEQLNNYILTVIPVLTTEKLNEIFEEHCAKE